jgi:asparagine synthase (glutamine-hydrolysing)
VTFTIQEGLDAIKDVIFHLETYDVTTVRASTPMYLMARVIKSMGIKMVLSGEGADEIFGGYLYFHKAPNSKEFHEETVRKIDKLHLYDCLRANKSLSAWGVEGRVPFLDKDFVDYSMNLDPNLKMIDSVKIEKHILRDSFKGYLPDDILWRQKEQFSDGVGYRVDYRTLSNFSIFSNISIWKNFSTTSNFYILTDIGKCTNVNVFFNIYSRINKVRFFDTLFFRNI